MPAQIGPWRIVATTGSGSAGTVYRARRADGSLDRDVARKVPRAAHALLERAAAHGAYREAGRIDEAVAAGREAVAMARRTVERPSFDLACLRWKPAASSPPSSSAMRTGDGRSRACSPRSGTEGGG